MDTKQLSKELFETYFNNEKFIIKDTKTFCEFIFALELALHTDGISLSKEPEAKILTRNHNPFTDFTVYSVNILPDGKPIAFITFAFDSDKPNTMHRIRVNNNTHIIEYSCYETDDEDDVVTMTFSDHMAIMIMDNFNKIIGNYYISKSSDGRTTMRFTYGK